MSNRAFSPASFPRLDRDRSGEGAAHARAVADGYAEGLRRAAVEQQRAETVARADVEAARRADSARVAAAVHALHAAVASLDARLAPVLAEADAALTEGALGIAEAVLGREVAGGHVDAADALRRVFSAVPSGRVITVRLNPADVESLEAEGMPPFAADVRLRADASLNRGDAVAELQHGWLDARLTAALERAREVLSGVRP